MILFSLWQKNRFNLRKKETVKKLKEAELKTIRKHQRVSLPINCFDSDNVCYFEKWSLVKYSFTKFVRERRYSSDCKRVYKFVMAKGYISNQKDTISKVLHSLKTKSWHSFMIFSCDIHLFMTVFKEKGTMFSRGLTIFFF